MPSIQKISNKVRHLEEKKKVQILAIIFLIGIVAIAAGMIFILQYLVIIGLSLGVVTLCLIIGIKRRAAEEE